MTITQDIAATNSPTAPASTPLSETIETNKYVNQALADHKREGLLLAVRSRWIGLAVIGILLLFTNPNLGVIYYEAILVGFAVIGYAQTKFWRVGRSKTELWLMFCDIALMTFVLVVPNPFVDTPWPVAMQYKSGSFIYFFFLLAGATLAYSWRTIVAMGIWTTGIWLTALVAAMYLSKDYPEMSAAVKTLTSDYPHIANLVAPENWGINTRIREVVIFLIVASTLALTGWRNRQLLTRHANVVRERTNLARYFSPNVVEVLSHNDDPLKQINTQNVAVLFVDIVGFTAMSDNKSPEQVINSLRDFHGRMEAEVFNNNGTLDKYLGDGLMATFGTPFVSEKDAGNALKCARGMIAAVERWNVILQDKGELPIHIGVGIHYGSVVLGDIGANRLEFSVIGSTVNIASRLEALTRMFETSLIVSQNLVAQIKNEPDFHQNSLGEMAKKTSQSIRGIKNPMDIWLLNTK